MILSLGCKLESPWELLQTTTLEWVNCGAHTLCNLHSTEHKLSTATWVNLTHLMLRDRSQTSDYITCNSIYEAQRQKQLLHGVRSQESRCLWGKMELGERHEGVFWGLV